MATKSVVWLSKNCLPCACQGTVNIFLLLKTGEIVPAQLIGTTKGNTCEGSCNYKYTISYSTLDLPDAITVLSSTDIDSAICDGAFTAYVRNYVDANLSTLLVSGEVLPFTPSYYRADGNLNWVELTPGDNFYVRLLGGFAFVSARFHSGTTSGVADSPNLVIGMPTGLVLASTIFIMSTYVEAGLGPFVGYAYTDVANNEIIGRKGDATNWALGALTGFSLSGLVRLA